MMADIFTPATRSQIMARIRSRDTGPELAVRSVLHRLGFRFRLHDRSLPGCPDVVLHSRGTALFVHGCFWHRHRCRPRRLPRSNRAFWKEKFHRNQSRDKRVARQLRRLGWKVIVVWECELRDGSRLERRLRRLLGD